MNKIVVLLDNKLKEIRLNFKEIKEKKMSAFKNKQIEIENYNKMLNFYWLLLTNVDKLENFKKWRVCMFELENTFKNFEKTYILQENSNKIYSNKKSLEKIQELIKFLKVELVEENKKMDRIQQMKLPQTPQYQIPPQNQIQVPGGKGDSWRNFAGAAEGIGDRPNHIFKTPDGARFIGDGGCKCKQCIENLHRRKF